MMGVISLLVWVCFFRAAVNSAHDKYHNGESLGWLHRGMLVYVGVWPLFVVLSMVVGK